MGHVPCRVQTRTGSGGIDGGSIGPVTKEWFIDNTKHRTVGGAAGGSDITVSKHGLIHMIYHLM